MQLGIVVLVNMKDGCFVLARFLIRIVPLSWSFLEPLNIDVGHLRDGLLFLFDVGLVDLVGAVLEFWAEFE